MSEHKMIAGYISMSTQLADEMRRIAEHEAAEVALVGELLAEHFAQVLDDES